MHCMTNRRLPPDMTEESEAAFFKSLTAEDTLGVVVRAAAQIDHHLLKLIEDVFVHPKALGSPADWTYEQRIRMAMALGLDPRLAPPLRAFGGLRNKYAHTIGYECTKSDINNLYKAFASHERELMQTLYNRMLADFPERQKRMSELPPFEKLQLFAVTLRKVLVAARIQVGEHTGTAAHGE